MKTVKLGDVCDIIGGGTPSKGNPIFWDGDIPWASVRDMKNPIIKTTEFTITEKGLKNSSTNLIPKNNVIIASRVGLGKVCWLQNNTAINQDLRAIIPKDAKHIDKAYLFWWLRSAAGKIKEAGVGATVRGVTLPFLKGLEVPLPTLEEQRRIVAQLDAAFEKIERSIELTEKNLQNSQSLHSSKMSGIFNDNSWPICELADHVKFIDYRGRTPKKTDSGIRLITAKNIKLGYLQDEPYEYVDPVIYSQWMTRGIPNKGDVLFTTEAPLANVAQLDTDEQVVFAQRCIILRPDRSFLDPSFLKYMIMTNPVRADILFNGTGTTVKGIKASVLKKIKIFEPSVQEQKEIAQELDRLTEQTQKLQILYRKKFDLLKALRQSLLQQAFSTTDKV